MDMKVWLRNQEIEAEIARDFKAAEKNLNSQLQRLGVARALEKCGKVERAIKGYESLVREEYQFAVPYERLAIIYRKLKRCDDEIRVVESGLKIVAPSQSSPQRTRWEARLVKAKSLRNKAPESQLA